MQRQGVRRCGQSTRGRAGGLAPVEPGDDAGRRACVEEGGINKHNEVGGEAAQRAGHVFGGSPALQRQKAWQVVCGLSGVLRLPLDQGARNQQAGCIVAAQFIADADDGDAQGAFRLFQPAQGLPERLLPGRL